jgi:hypothetical protein
VGGRAAAQDAEKNLLGKYQKKTQQHKEKLKADIDEVLKKAKAIEKRSPDDALELVRDARDRLVGSHVFSVEEEGKLFQPLADRIAALKLLIHDRQGHRLGDVLTVQKESVRDWYDRLDKIQQTGTDKRNPALTGLKPVGTPALLAFRNGTYAYALLKAKPIKGIPCTVDGRENVFLPNEVVGVKIQSGYYLYVAELQRYAYVTNHQAFIITAPMRLTPPPPELPRPVPPPIIQSTAAAVKPAAIDEPVKLVFTYGPTQLPLFLVHDRSKIDQPSAATMRAARDALIEAQIKNYLSRMSEFQQNRFKEKIITILNNNPGMPLSPLVQEDLEYQMSRSMPNAGQWPGRLLEFINHLVQENQAPQMD